MQTKLLIIFFFFCLSANAQFDTTRIKTFNDKLQVGLFMSDNYAKNTFQYGNNQLEQMPALKPSLGVQFAYNGIVLAVATGFPIAHLRYKNYEVTKTLNINGYLSRPKYLLWGAIRRFKGFEYSTANEIFGNASMLNISGSFMYIFNENKYAFRAAFRQSEQQMKSGGSWLLKGQLSYNDIFDSNLVVLRGDDFRGFNAAGLAVLGGYGYTLNLNKNWFASALLLSGIDYKRGSHHDIPRLTERNQPFNSFTPAFDFKSSIGYNTAKFYMALTFDVNNSFAVNNVEEIDFKHQYFKTDLRFGVRIDAPAILKKIRF